MLFRAYNGKIYRRIPPLARLMRLRVLCFGGVARSRFYLRAESIDNVTLLFPPQGLLS